MQCTRVSRDESHVLLLLLLRYGVFAYDTMASPRGVKWVVALFFIRALTLLINSP